MTAESEKKPDGRVATQFKPGAEWRGSTATQFKPGDAWTGNKLGRPKKAPPPPPPPPPSVKELARECTQEAIETLKEIMRDTSASKKDRANAATALLDRGHGRPVAHIETTVGRFDQMSADELISFITGVPLGEVIEGELVYDGDGDDYDGDQEGDET